MEIKNMGITEGFLDPGKKALPHFHKISEEIYYILSGQGKVRVGDFKTKIKAGDAIYIPVKAIHALKNTSPARHSGKRQQDKSKKLKVLAISAPPYSDNDTFFIDI